MKTILLHVQDDPALDERVQAALKLAQCFSAHLICLHVTPIEAYAAVGAFDGANLISDVMQALETAEAAVRDRVQARLQAEEVSWTYEQVTGPVAGIIARRSALADLVVAGRAVHSSKARWVSQIGLLGDLLHRCRTPLLIPPASAASFNPSGPALIAWDGSFEASNAVRASLSFLKASSRVAVLQVSKSTEEKSSTDELLVYLRRHGITADEHAYFAGHEDVARIIACEALALDSATVVMGGYHHSRLGELVFGGVTRTLLTDCPTALLITH